MRHQPRLLPVHHETFLTNNPLDYHAYPIGNGAIQVTGKGKVISVPCVSQAMLTGESGESMIEAQHKRVAQARARGRALYAGCGQVLRTSKFRHDSPTDVQGTTRLISLNQ